MSIAENIARVQEQIAAACRRAGRAAHDVQLMAVTKTHPPERILEAHAAGLRLFGENRVQELAGKQAVLAAAGTFSGPVPASFHMIGPLQSNKVMRAMQLVDAVDAVDSQRLAERLEQAAAAAGRLLPVLLEIKLSPEASKHGLAPDGPELAALLEQAPEWPHLKICGLMTVPPFAEDLEESRPYFRRLRQLRGVLAQKHPHLALEQLSMGMSHDFPVAIEEGSTCVRIGTAIFGERKAGERTTP
ncbi:MAG: YggS family pyridoxal phosphate-dependent enzyme [Acidobacteriaceae bacterium]